MRRVVPFPCEGALLLGTLDEAEGATGILIVSGGNEVRCGAHRGMATLAQRLAAAGIPVFRFDRRGIGDSEGENRGYGSSAPDLAAALTAFRREQPHVGRIIGFGNCDAATALLLLAHACDAVVLANPWLGDESAPPPPAALRRHYLRRLRNPAAWRALLAGGFLHKVMSLRSLLGSAREQPLEAQVAAALANRPTTIVLATRDRTAQVFAGSVRVPTDVAVIRLDTSSHSFADAGDALVDILLAAADDFRVT